ncbi:nuclear valosin-containing protein-like [Oppia nitens]|uniref:nuclear valosin-containing protein-like n=1 Tax=Oppia nitens TaxID=1686743 RepID=UPI0023DA5116|nr:nuclear valosin-containing protein-like [Oppia nitens]
MSLNSRKRVFADDNGFIPLSSSTQKSQNNDNRYQQKKQNKSQNVSIFGDRHLYSRVKEILTKSDVNDNQILVNQLQKTYSEYKRKKSSVLMKSVCKALEMIDNDLSSDVMEDDISGQSIDDITDPLPNDDINFMNNSLNDLYSTNSNQTNRNKLRDSSGQNITENSGHSKYNNTRKSDKRSENSKTVSQTNNKADRNIDSLLTKQIQLKERYLCEPKLTFEDFGGIDNIVIQIKKLLFHLRHPTLYMTIGVDPPRGFLLHGPPGVGKTAIVEAIANDLKIPFLKCGATEIVAGISGESEGKIRELFSLANSLKPCILFIDEIDSITPKRENASKEMERRIVTQLLTSLDNLGTSDSQGVMVIGATNRPDAIDPALRRAGRFDREISLGIPDQKSRTEILKVITKSVKLCDNFDIESLAHKTPGYVGADLKSLIREAAINALERILLLQNIDINLSFDSNQMNIDNLTSLLTIDMCDFDSALKQIQPSSKREGFATVPDVTWSDVGALENVRKDLQLSILAPIRYEKDVKALGLTTSVGILLCGPPGCGKTLLAKAIANESGINFISVKGPELLNMYVGESERAVRSVFNRARNSKPCVVFFDEIDALCPKRNDSESSNASSRVVNQLLTEMDGLESRDCFLLAATNRPDIIDPAILRPGRFDKILYVGFPSKADRYEILKTLSKNGTKPPFSADIDLKTIAEDTRLDGLTGADLHSLLRECSLSALSERISSNLAPNESIIIKKCHIECALNKVKPSVSNNERKIYEKMSNIYDSKH